MQNALTVITPILPGHVDELEKLLVEIGRSIDKPSRINFSRLSMIYFARWVIIGGPKDAAGGEARLVFGTDHDGDDAALLAALHEQAAPLLGEIYGHCESAPASLAGDARSFQSYMLEHRVEYQGRHIAYHNHTVASVRNALDLREAVETHLDQTFPAGCAAPEDAAAVGKEVLDFIRNRCPVRPQPSPTGSNPVMRNLILTGLLILAAFLVIGILSGTGLIVLTVLVLLVIAGAAVFWFRQTLAAHERRDTLEFKPPPLVVDARDLQLGENRVVQNQMTHIVPIKKGRFRRNTLRLVLWAINLLAAVYYNKGKLGGIPTIHFARWMIIDGGERLMFFSNFDGSWERYLGDFVDQAHNGLTAVWSNTIGFPPTRGLVNEGASNVDVFKAWTRQYQIRTQVWYSAYPTSTVTNIRNAIALREEISAVEKVLVTSPAPPASPASPASPVSPAASAAVAAWLLRL